MKKVLKENKHKVGNGTKTQIRSLHCTQNPLIGSESRNSEDSIHVNPDCFWGEKA